jgi:two-component system LytT family response regulator
MKALIVDDEPLARRELKRLLADFAWIEIVGEAANIDEAHKRIEELSPELVFLDIKMPGGSGFDLLERLEQVPQVIFTTAYDQHAVKAFEVNALDYLLKPIEPERLAAAIARARKRVDAPSQPRSHEPALDQLFVRDGPRCWFVPLSEVALLTADGNYVRLLWGNRQPLLGRPLTAIEERLDPKQFFRANRRQIFNLAFVERVELGIGGRLHVQLRGGPEVEISRRQARVFRQQTTV